MQRIFRQNWHMNDSTGLDHSTRLYYFFRLVRVRIDHSLIRKQKLLFVILYLSTNMQSSSLEVR